MRKNVLWSKCPRIVSRPHNGLLTILSHKKSKQWRERMTQVVRSCVGSGESGTGECTDRRGPVKTRMVTRNGASELLNMLQNLQFLFGTFSIELRIRFLYCIICMKAPPLFVTHDLKAIRRKFPFFNIPSQNNHNSIFWVHAFRNSVNRWNPVIMLQLNNSGWQVPHCAALCEFEEYRRFFRMINRQDMKLTENSVHFW